jgi:hypothetical protein
VGEGGEEWRRKEARCRLVNLLVNSRERHLLEDLGGMEDIEDRDETLVLCSSGSVDRWPQVEGNGEGMLDRAE